MFTIIGATGRVGSAVADHLLRQGHAIRVFARDAERAASLARRGAEVVTADLEDRGALTASFADADGVFVMLPFDPAVPDVPAHLARLRGSMVGAVADSAVPHVTMLSSLGADLPDGNGPIVDLYHLEEELRAVAPALTAVRAPHFQEKVSEVLDLAQGRGIYPVFGSAEAPIPMVATRDVGAAAAEALLQPAGRHEVVDLDAPAVTERHVAHVLGELLGRSLDVVEIPEVGWVDAFEEAGFPSDVAVSMADLYRATERGLLVPRGDRLVECSTPIEQTLAELVGVPA